MSEEIEKDGVAVRLIRQRAEELIQLAEAVGVVVTIELEPLQPLAMGHHRMTVTVQEKQHY